MDENTVKTEKERIAEETAELEAKERKTEFTRELIFLLLLTVFSLFLFGMSIQLWMPGFEVNSPGMYPGLTTIGMLVCCAISIFQLFRKRKNMEDWDEHGAWNRLKLSLGAEIPFVVFVMIVAAILYVVAMGLIGFYISTFVYLAFSIFFLFKGKKEKLRPALLVAAGTILAVYVIIDLIFQIRMP